MKKVLLVIVFILILIAIPATVFLVKQQQDIRQRAVAASRIYFDPTPVTKNVGDEFILNVMLSTDTNFVTAAEIHVNYNPTYLEGQTFEVGDFFNATLVAPTISSGNATITVGINDTAGRQGTGIAAKLKLKALAATTTPIQVAFGKLCNNDTLTENCTQAVGVGEGAHNVLIGTEVALVTIQSAGGATPSPTPTATPGGATPTPSASPSGMSPSPSSSVSPSPTPSATPGGATPTPSPTPSASPGAVTKIINPANGSSTTNKRPPINGTSFANALVIMSINTSTPISQTGYANSSGNWSFSLTVDINPGTYTIAVDGEDPVSGKIEKASSTFTITSAGGAGGTAIATPTPTPQPTSTPASGGVGSAPAASPATTKGGTPVTGSATPTLALFAVAASLILLGFASTIFNKKK